MSDQLEKKPTYPGEEFNVPPELKKQALNTAIFEATQIRPFDGSVLQCMNIEYIYSIPRAGVRYCKDARKFIMYINPYWFCMLATQPNRRATLIHEICHVTHQHLVRAPMYALAPSAKRTMNVAADMVINQHIADMPDGCNECPPVKARMHGVKCQNKKCPGDAIQLKDFYDLDKDNNMIPWPAKQTMEFYYHKLIERLDDGEDGSEGGKGAINLEFDSHDWEDGAEESEILDATEDLIKRAMQKNSFSYSEIPTHVQELLHHIEKRRAEMNYKAILQWAIKRHASSTKLESTWSRFSRRHGSKAPGNKDGSLPKLDQYMDTSGSISVEEANEFLSFMDNLIKQGDRKCKIHLWHTSLYYSQKYKIGDKIPNAAWQSGGTDIGPTLQKIYDKKSDLSIILTDGCYSDVDFESLLKCGEKFPQVVFVISKNGNENHPLKRLGITVKIPNDAR